MGFHVQGGNLPPVWASSRLKSPPHWSEDWVQASFGEKRGGMKPASSETDKELVVEIDPITRAVSAKTAEKHSSPVPDDSDCSRASRLTSTSSTETDALSDEKDVSASYVIFWSLKWLYEYEFPATCRAVTEIVIQAAWAALQPFVVVKLFETTEEDDSEEPENLFFERPSFITLLWSSAILMAGEMLMAQVIYLYNNDSANGAAFICSTTLRLVRHLLNTSFEELEKFNIPHFMTMLESDVIVLNENVNAVLCMGNTSLQLFVLCLILINLSSTLSVVLMALSPLYIIYNQKLGKKITLAANDQRQAEKAFAASTEHVLSRVLVTRHCGLKQTMDDMLVAANSRQSDCFVQFDEETALNVRGQTLLSILLSVSVLVGGAYLVSSEGFFGDRLTYGEFIAFYLASTSLHSLMTDLTASLNQINKSKVSLQTVMFYLSQPELYVIGNTEMTLSEERGPALKLTRVVMSRCSLVTQDLRPILHDVSFEVPVGSKCGMVGASGAGKSTILKLIGGLYQMQGGSIQINRVDLADVNTVKLMAMLEAEVLLFEGKSIEYNCCVGEVVDLGKLDACLHMAYLKADVNMMELSAQTLVERNGLSSGLKQRLGLARALYRVAMGRRILLLDEPTSNQDPKAMVAIRDWLCALTEVTVLAATHGLTLLKEFDQILVIEHGMCVEYGAKKDLMKARGYWYKLYYDSMGLDVDETGTVSIEPRRLLKMWLFAAPAIKPEMLKPFTNYFITRSCEAGEVFFTEGDAADAMYVVVGGRLEEKSSKGGRSAVAKWKSGDVMGLDNLAAEDKRHTTTCTVTASATLLMLPRMLFRFALKNSPELEHHIDSTVHTVMALRSVAFLRAIWLFAGLTAEQLSTIQEHLVIRVFQVNAHPLIPKGSDFFFSFSFIPPMMWTRVRV
ncbi:hypothetical protein CYMTET_5304 [Cymbomonas tetramitiformis]|uniref:Uncharacterized protein n=1 Tax=Cymbomonas tetramitiformis TaxID=36881 RepID=A0AAE0GZM4_9CHLO|nr:hypothetical protein CYMTET_5304 [Cymbomonas tetramitiformis]